MSTPPSARASDGVSAPAFAPARAIRGTILRRSLKFTLLAWIPGAFWQGATGNTAMTPLGQFLGANDLIFSLISQAAPLLSVLLMIPGSMVVERLGRRKTFFIWTVSAHRAVYILIGLLPWVLPKASLSTGMVLAALVFVSMGFNSFGGQAWVNWMADLVPPRIRGKYFAGRSRMGVAIVGGATILVALILDGADRGWASQALAPIEAYTGLPPLIFTLSLIFIVAGAVGMLDPLLFAKVAEPPMKPAVREPLAAWLIRPLRDAQFRRFVTYWSVWNCANSWCGWFWMLYLLDFLQTHRQTLPGWAQFIYLTAAIVQPVGYMIGQFLGYPIWGRAVDRFGRKPVFFVSSTIHTFSWLSWMFLSPAMLPWMLPIQILGGLFGGGMDIASFNIMLHFNRKGGSGYQAVGSVIFSVAGALSAFAAGSLATALAGFQLTVAAGTPYEHTFNRYAVLILVGAIIKYTGDFVFLRRVQDIDSKPAGHALRFMLNNLNGTLNTLIFVPIRSGVEATGESIRRLWR